MSLFFCARLLAPLMSLVLVGQGAAMAETVRARYSVSLIGLHIGEATAHGSIEQANYRIELNARLTGVASWVAHVRMALQSSGFIRRSTVLPSAYATSSANEHMTRTLRMALNAGNVRAVEITPPFMDMDGRVPVSAANKRNILDPISALIMAVPAGESLVGPAACNRTLPIYDGVIRFDLTMSYVRTQEVAVPGYSGPVSVCAVRYRPIAGHKIDSESTRFMAQNREIQAWLAPVEGAHIVVPFRVQLKTLAGMADVEATEFSIDRDPVTAKREH
jgi:NAD(P)-dependent dehydrogenase (short-subunit alcohol dehydrogenase family)